jgi:prepilin-type N-terminal cleavage/methylation domain-containing protein
MITCGKKTQSGRSMIEMLGVLAIVGILSAGGIAGYSMAMQSYKVSALTEKVNLIAQQSRVLFNGVYDNATANTDGTTAGDGSMGAVLLKAGMVTDLNNPFGSYLKVKGGEGGTGAENDEFTVETSDANIPAEACIKLLRTDWGTTGVFTEISVGGTAVGKSSDGSSPVATATAVSKCANGNKKITWKFK